MTRLQWIGSVLVAAATLVGLAFAIFVDPSVPFLLPLRGAAWIAPELPVDNALRRVAPGQSYGAVFTRDVELTRSGPRVIAVRALGRVSVRIDGQPVLAASEPRACLKRRCEIDIALAAGVHALEVVVVNAAGPPLLALRMNGPDSQREVWSDTQWQVAPPANPAKRAPAVLADDTRRFPTSSSLGPAPLQAARERAPALAGLALLGALCSVALRRGASRERAGIALPLLGAGIVLLWLILAFGTLPSLALKSGFDASGHLAYVRYIAAGRGLPDASQGWSMYHPPLFYALAALPVSLAQPPLDGQAERFAMRLVPWLMALANIALVGLAARRVFPERRRAQAAAIAFAALLPLHVLQASYVSNEIAHAFFVSAALVLAMRCMEEHSEAARARWQLVALGGLLGLCLLSKFTALLVTALVCAFVAFERWQARGQPLPSALRAALVVGCCAALTSGAFYLRNWWRFGDLFVWNLDVPGQASWWVQPGFHTPAFFVKLGDAWRAPFYSAFHSFWDAQYTTFWGDGLVAGRTVLAQRPLVWDWDWMSVTYLLAVPASLLIVSGAWQLARESFEHANRSRRCSLALCIALLWLLGAASLSATLRYPFYGTPRASYALSLLVPLSLCAARGFVSFDTLLAVRRGPLFEGLRTLYHGWLTALGASIVLTYFIVL